MTIFIWIVCSVIFLFILLLILVGISTKIENREKYKEWLLDLNQWEIDDEVEIGFAESCYPYEYGSEYYNVLNNKSINQISYHTNAVEKYKIKNPMLKPEAFVKLIKWDETDALIEFANGVQTYTSTKFIFKNISYIKRKLDKKTDTFVLTKQEKIKKLRKDKLIRVLKENEE